LEYAVLSVHAGVRVAAGKSGDEGDGHQASSRSLTTTVVVAVIVGVLLASPLVTGYVWWFKSHRPRDRPDIEHRLMYI